MSDDSKKRLDDLTKVVDRLNDSYEKAALRKRAWEALDNALSAVKLSHDMYASTNNTLIDEAARYLEAIGRSDAGKPGYSYQPRFLLHFAVAIRAMSMSPQAAQDMYKELGEKYVEKFHG